MINQNQKSASVINVHPQTGYFVPSNTALHKLLTEDRCGDCFNMSRVSMCCYAATKSASDKNATVARIQPKEKPKPKKFSKFGEMETSLALDNYDAKLMNSIWGRYNWNSPHNLKKQNVETAAAKGQEPATTEMKFKSPRVHFTVPNFVGIVSVETTLEVTKPKTSVEKLESLFNFPIF